MLQDSFVKAGSSTPGQSRLFDVDPGVILDLNHCSLVKIMDMKSHTRHDAGEILFLKRSAGGWGVFIYRWVLVKVWNATWRFDRGRIDARCVVCIPDPDFVYSK